MNQGLSRDRPFLIYKRLYNFKTYKKKVLADTLTPVSIYQKVREKFSNSILLESSDYGVNDNSYAYICFNPISHISIKKQQIEIEYPDQRKKLISKQVIVWLNKLQDFVILSNVRSTIKII